MKKILIRELDTVISVNVDRNETADWAITSQRDGWDIEIDGSVNFDEFSIDRKVAVDLIIFSIITHNVRFILDGNIKEFGSHEAPMCIIFKSDVSQECDDITWCV